MKGPRQYGFVRNTLALSFFSIFLSACLMGEEESKSTDGVAVDHELSGSVGDGPIIGASIRILQNDGVELAQLESDSNANYTISVRAMGEYYPLSIESRGGTDIVTNSSPDFDLLGAVLEPGEQSTANVNPFTTITVELARELPGGIDKVNLETAQTIVTAQLNNGLRSLVGSGVMRTEINGGTVAEIVRASEALGETIRRTRNALNASGFSTSGNDVLLAVSSDLKDGVVDGAGGSAANARIGAVWTVVSAQVLLETMANELYVNGGNATALLNNAINQVSEETANPSMASLTVTNEMLEKSGLGLEAAFAVSDDARIRELANAVSDIDAGTGSSTVRNFALPGDYRGLLNNVILLIAGGSSAVIDTVNDIARGEVTPPAPTPPPSAGGGAVTLSWVAPTRNEDGSNLTDLAGFRIYWRTGSGSYANSVTIEDANATSHVFNDLPSGSYEFVATSFNRGGTESSYSDLATRVVP